MRVVTGIYGGLISGYTARMAAFADGKRLDKLSETRDSVGDFRVFTYARLARYPAEGVAGYSVVERNRCAVVHCAVTSCDFPYRPVSCLSPGARPGARTYAMTS